MPQPHDAYSGTIKAGVPGIPRCARNDNNAILLVIPWSRRAAPFSCHSAEPELSAGDEESLMPSPHSAYSGTIKASVPGIPRCASE
jgi:hypothetical protein